MGGQALASTAATGASIATAPETAADQALSARDFGRVAARIGALAGIVLEPHKSSMIQTRIGRRVRALGLGSITEYLDLLETRSGGDELQNFIDTLTTNLTSFFREDHHMDHLARTVLRQQGELRIWSAGCSSGEEPYSIAMVAARTLNAEVRRLKVLATDLDSAVLARARRGRYAAERCETIDRKMRGYLEAVPEEDAFDIAGTVKDLVTFKQLNLIERWPMNGPFDAIFCRNVVIYFSAETKARLLDRFAALLRPGGFLYLGHSEAILGHHRYFESCGNTIYLRRDGGA